MIIKKRRLVFLYLSCFSFFCLCSFRDGAQGIDDALQTFKNALQNRNAEQASLLFDQTISSTYNSNQSTYTQEHAQIILNDFYTKAKPKSFKVNFTGTIPHSDDKYVIGTVHSENAIYTVYIYLKNKSGRYFIQEMKISQ